MKARNVFLVAAMAVLLASPVPPAVAQVRVGIGIQIGPPPMRREVIAPRPGYAAEWVRGYWSWDPAMHKHVWVEGRWIASRPGYRWVDGGWKNGSRGWIWTEGHWRGGRGARDAREGERIPNRGGMRR
jgi:hypothetical protein